MKLARNLCLILMCATLAIGAVGQKKPKGKKGKPADDSVAPDKVLYEKATDEIKHGKYEVARLQLQALLNTYPDSEYLAKAKLAVADSYFKEGGSGNLTLAIDEYKSFITFFPYMDEAAYAQMQVAMTHYRRLDKPDRDRSEAELAEQEFQIFLQKYPNSPLTAVSEQRLRDVQEMLAEGDFRIASYYDTKKSYKAALARYNDIANRYPLFSRSDLVLMKLGDLWQKAPLNATADQKEQMELARKQLAATYYAKIVTDYPLSNLVPKAKDKLTSMGVAIPQPNPVALARMQQDQEIPRDRPRLVGHVTGMIHSAPDMSMSARSGTPNMNPPDDYSASDPLKPGTGGLNVVGASGGAGAGGTTSSSGGGSGTTTTGDSGSSSSSSSGSNAGVQLLSTGGTTTTPAGTTGPVAPTTVPPPPPTTGGASGESTSAGSTSGQPPATSVDSTKGTAQPATAKPCGSDSKSGGSSKDKKSDCKPDSTKESSSRKKGIRRVIPW